LKTLLLNTFALLYLGASTSFAQSFPSSDNLPKPGVSAPELTFTQLLQAHSGTKVDWPSLRGKVVVLELWATWCAPCVAEIPIVNSLVASVDSAKVQFISVDGFEDSDNAIPTTMIIDTEGKVVSTTVRPEQLKAEQLLALAEGNKVTFGGPVDPAVQAKLDAALAKAIASHDGSDTDSVKPLFAIVLKPADPPKDGKKPMTMMKMVLGPGQIDITNASPSLLLQGNSGLSQPVRTVVHGVIPDTSYSLHVSAPNAAQSSSRRHSNSPLN